MRQDQDQGGEGVVLHAVAVAAVGGGGRGLQCTHSDRKQGVDDKRCLHKHPSIGTHGQCAQQSREAVTVSPEAPDW